MLYDCKTNNQSKKRYTMASLKEENNPAPNPPKRSRIEAEEEQMHRTDRRTGSYGFAGRYPAINFIKRKTVF